MKVKKFILNIFFNGDSYVISSYKVFTLYDLIQFFNYKKNLIVLEYNGKIAHPQTWKNQILKEKDKIELVTIVGGG